MGTSRVGPQWFRRRLETKNDESRFGLTRAPFFERRGVRSVAKVIACRRAAQSGNRRDQIRRILFAALTDESTSQCLAFAALALIYGSAVMTIVIVTLVKSARKRSPETQKKS